VLGEFPDAPLHAFEHQMKLFIDFGMFFFTLANAGVPVDTLGPFTLTIVGSLVLGKMLFITAIVLLASWCKVAPLNARISATDLTMTSAAASIGLTVALFIAGEAFKYHPQLQAEAKMGALLSGLMGALCLAFAHSPLWRSGRAQSTWPPTTPALSGSDTPEADGDDDPEDVAYIVASTLEYQITRARVFQMERKAILRNTVDQLPSPISLSGRRGPGSPSASSRQQAAAYGSFRRSGTPASSSRRSSKRSRASPKDSPPSKTFGDRAGMWQVV
jgi:hypothetical protein